MILSPQNITPALNIKQISDQYIRKNFQNLSDYFKNQNQLLNFKFFELVFTAATNQPYTLAHGLGFIPQDLIMLNCVGLGAISFNFGQADTQTITITTTAACRIRFFIGAYWNYQSSYNFQPTDAMVFSPTPVVSNTGLVIYQASGTPSTSSQVATISGSQTITPGQVSQLTSINGAFVQALPPSATTTADLMIEKSSSDLNIITLQCSGNDTIQGQTFTTLSTQYEFIVLTPITGGYMIKNRYIQSVWVNAGAIGITGASSNPSKGTIVNDKVWWRREGPDAVVRMEYRQSTAGTSGSGTYILALPSGIVPDINQMDTSAGSVPGGTADFGTTGLTRIGAALIDGVGALTLYEGAGNAFWGSGDIPLSDSVVFMGLRVQFPVLGWKQ